MISYYLTFWKVYKKRCDTNFFCNYEILTINKGFPQTKAFVRHAPIVALDVCFLLYIYKKIQSSLRKIHE